jgi:hypothetical protein
MMPTSGAQLAIAAINLRSADAFSAGQPSYHVANPSAVDALGSSLVQYSRPATC